MTNNLFLDVTIDRAPHARDAVGAVFIGVLLVAGGLLQLFGAFRARRGEFKSTIGRQLAGAFGPRGALIFLLGLGVALLGAGGFWLVRFAL